MNSNELPVGCCPHCNKLMILSDWANVDMCYACYDADERDAHDEAFAEWEAKSKMAPPSDLESLRFEDLF